MPDVIVTERRRPKEPSSRRQLFIWLGMIGIVTIEVWLTYARLPVRMLLGALLLLACTEAALGLLYLMHLRYERAVFRWWTLPTLVFVLLLMNEMWPDAFRLVSLRRP